MRKHRSRTPLLHRVHDYFFPHRRNNYRPHFFSTTSIAVLAIGILLLEGAYVTQVKLVFTNTNFLASVLPGVLADLTNQDRSANGDAPVVENPVLDQAAEAAAQDMASKGYFAHVSPDGKSPWYWLDQAGYQYQYAGENLAVNFSDSQELETAWMNSPTHRANIVKPQYTQVGFGTADGVYQGAETTFVVTFFASPAAAEQGTPAPPAIAKNNIPAVAVTPPALKPAPVAIAANAPSAAQKIPAVANETPPPASAVAENVPATTSAILGTQTTALAAPTVSAAEAQPNWFAKVLASPRSSVTAILGVLLALVAVLFAIAVVVRLRVQHASVFVGATALVALGLVAIVFDYRFLGPAHPTTIDQSASAITAFGP